MDLIQPKTSKSLLNKLNYSVLNLEFNIGKKERKKTLFHRIIFITLVLLTASLIRRKAFIRDDVPKQELQFSPSNSPLSRHLLQASSTTSSTENATGTVEGHQEKNCTEPSINEFPSDFFTQEQRKQGALLVHFLISIYMFTALAIVCDDYFVPSLEHISEKLHFTEDVAGATFMAAGSSAPELFTSIIGVFVAKGDVGVGTIVGSAVFNILVIIGLCGLCCANPVALHWWPLMRDSTYYGISIAALIAVIYDGAVTWAEALVMLILYVGYILIMKFNAKLEGFVSATRKKTVKRINKHRGKSNDYKPEDEKKEEAEMKDSSSLAMNGSSPGTLEKKIVLTRMNGHSTTVDADREVSSALLPTLNGGKNLVDLEKGNQNGFCFHAKSPPQSPLLLSVDEVIFARSRPIGFEEAGLRVMMSSTFAPKTRLRMACKVLIHERQNLLVKNSDIGSNTERVLVRRKTDENLSIGSPVLSRISGIEEDRLSADNLDASDDDGYTHPFRPPKDSWIMFCKWLLCWPISTAFFFTIPNCSKRRWERWFMVSFFVSTLWIAGCSYIMVWMVVVCGYTLNIPDTIMGITFLAAGTSVPDTIASVIVARQGLGDMAVSNSLGSNVFDILLGLAFPWFIKTAMLNTGSTVVINSRGLLWSVLLLMTSLFFVITAIHLNGWKLTKKLGFFVIIAYGVFLTFSILIEFNVFFPVNLPMCRY